MRRPRPVRLIDRIGPLIAAIPPDPAIQGTGRRVEVDASRHLIVDLWDSSWTLYDDEREMVTQGGPRRLWDTEVALYDAWCAWGRPTRERFGLSVPASGGAQDVWLDDPRSERRWLLAGWVPEVESASRLPPAVTRGP